MIKYWYPLLAFFGFFCIVTLKTSYASDVVIATGDRNGTYFAVGNDLKKIIDIDVVESTGSISNLVLLNKGMVDIAISQEDAVKFYKNFFLAPSGGDVNVIKVTSTLYPEEIHIIVSDKIRNVAELNNSTISCGKKNSGSCLTKDFISYSYGIRMKTLNYGYKESIRKVKNGTIDAAIITVGAPSEILKDETGIKLLSMPKNQKMESEGGYTFGQIPSKTYKFLNEDVNTYKINSVLVQKSVKTLNLVKDICKQSEILLLEGHKKWVDIINNNCR